MNAYTRMIRKIIFVLAILFILFTLLVNIIRLLLPYSAYYMKNIEQFIKAETGYTVSIQSLDLHVEGYWPVLEFKGVNIPQANIQIDTVAMRINVVYSLFYRTLWLSRIAIVGTDLQVVQDAKSLRINQLTIPLQSTQTVSSEDRVVKTLLNHSTLMLRRVSLNYRYQKQVVDADLHFLTLENNNDEHHLSGDVDILSPVRTATVFRLDMQGDLLQPQHLHTNVYVNTTEVPVLQLLPFFQKLPVQMTSGDLAMELWAQMDAQGVHRVQSIFALKNVGMKTARGARTVQQASAHLLWQRQAQEWSLTLDDLHLTYEQHEWPVDQLFLTSSGVHQKVFVNYVDVKDAAEFLSLLPQVNSQQLAILKKINPTGTLSNVIFSDDEPGFSFGRMQISGDFFHISTAAYKRFPGVQEMNGHMILKDKHLQVGLFSKRLVIDDKELFKRPVVMPAMQAFTSLDFTAWPQVQLNQLTLQNSDMSLAGRGWINTNAAHPSTSLLMGLHIYRLENLKRYVPSGIMAPEFYAWFYQAFMSGSAKGALLVHGDLKEFPFDQSSDVFAARFSMDNLGFSFSPEWPAMKSPHTVLSFHGSHIHVHDAKASVLNVALNNFAADIPVIKDKEPIMLRVRGLAEGTYADVLSVLTQSSLKERVAAALTPLQLGGHLKLALQLKVPLSEKHSEVQVYGQLHVDQGTLQLWGQTPEITQLTGDLSFTDIKLNADKLTGLFYQQPMVASMHTTAADELAIDLHSKINFAELSTIFQVSLAEYASGETLFNAHILTPLHTPGPAQTLVSVDSDLQGIEVLLPAPFAKTKDTAQSFFAKTVLTDGTLKKIDFEYGQAVQATLALTSHPAMDTTYSLSLYLKQFDLKTWQAYFHQNLSSANASEGAAMTNTFRKKIDAVSLRLDTLEAYNQSLKNFMITLHSKPKAWLVTVDSDRIKGNVYWPDDQHNEAVQGDFEILHLAAFPDALNSTNDNALTELPSITFQAKEMSYGVHVLGAVALKLKKTLRGYSLEELKTQSPVLSLDVHGQWQKNKIHPMTSLSGEASSSNLKKLLQEWDVESSLTAQTGKIKFDTQWAGDPQSFDLKTTVANFTVGLGAGAIINLGKNADNKIGLGRLVTALSVQSIINTLTFQSNALKEGYQFNSMNGDFVLGKGVLRTQKTTFLGNVADIAVSGLTDLVRHEFNLRLAVTPHVTSSLPVLAGVVINPIFGVASWVADKMLSPQINKFTTYYFLLTGPWDKPDVVSLDRANATSTSGDKAHAAS